MHIQITNRTLSVYLFFLKSLLICFYRLFDWICACAMKARKHFDADDTSDQPFLNGTLPEVLN